MYDERDLLVRAMDESDMGLESITTEDDGESIKTTSKHAPLINRLRSLDDAITRVETSMSTQKVVYLKALQAAGDKSAESTGLELLASITASISQRKVNKSE
jgi:hypothetical protein